MDWLRKLATRAAAWVRGRNPEDDTAEEIRLHKEERAAELEDSGLSAADAAAQAAREFGSTLLFVEESRDAWSLGWVEDLLRDLRYGARALLRDPAFTLTAIASLALGIGVNTTTFSLTTELMFSEPSVRDASRLAYVRVGGNSHTAPTELQFLRDAGVFEALAGYDHGEINWSSGDSGKRLFAFQVTSDFFSVLGVPVAAGRPIAPGDRDAVVVTDRFWKTRLSSDPNALKRELRLNGRPHSIVGILPENHRTLTGVGYSPDVYVPLLDRNARVQLYGRLRQRASRESTREAIRIAMTELDRLHPEPDYKRAEDVRLIGVASFSRLHTGDMVPVAVFFTVLMAAVSLVLLVACINVAGLLLARAASRRHELAIRTSIGASRSRLVRQLMAESLLLSAIATGAGVGLNVLLTRALGGLQLPLPFPIVLRVDPDWRLLTYGAAVFVATAVLAGLLPALRAARSSLATDASREVSSGSRLRASLVVAQVAVTVVVLAVTVLSLRNLAGSASLSPGFDVDRLVYAHMRLVPERYADDAAFETLAASVLAKVRALPGAEAVAAVRTVPFNGQETHGGTVALDGLRSPLPVERVYNQVSPDYFRAMGIEIVAGREFNDQDARSGVRLAVVNQVLAKRVWGGSNPVGSMIRFGRPGGQFSDPVEIIGVCENSKFMTIGESAKPAVYEPFRASQDRRRHKLEIVARTASPTSLLRAVEGALLDLDSSAAVDVKPLRQAMGMAVLPSQVGAGLFGIIGLVGLCLASIGLYGVLTYGVARQVREIGVRMALGASGGSVVRLVLGHAARVVGTGIVFGTGLALLITQPLSLFLIADIKPTDPVNYAFVGLILVLVALAASFGPALRAVRIHPSVALRGE